MKRRDIITLNIEATEFGGRAYGHVGEIRVNVKHGIPGQKVRVYIKKIKDNIAKAEILEVLDKSPMEDQETCLHYGKCGGCSIQSIGYNKQLDLKEGQVKRLFDQAGIKDYEWLGIEGSPEIFEYRNKMEFSFGDEEKDGPLTLGMHKKGRYYDIVTVDSCLIMDEDFRKILTKTLEFFTNRKIDYYHTRRHEGYLRHLVVRKANFTGEILINLVTTSQEKVDLMELVDEILEVDFEGKVVGFLHTINNSLANVVESEETNILFGRDYIKEKLLGLEFKISPFSFFQTNSQGAEKLYSIVREFVGNADDQVVFDLYCGTGTIGQIVAPKARKVIGIEIVEDAVKAARENAELNGLDNCTFIAGDVKEEVKNLNEKPDIIIIDPPRAGINPNALKDIISFGADKIVYVSCNPRSLVNDLVEFEESGYRVDKVKCMDMFAHTNHCEVICKLERE